MQKTLYT